MPAARARRSVAKRDGGERSATLRMATKQLLATSVTKTTRSASRAERRARPAKIGWDAEAGEATGVGAKRMVRPVGRGGCRGVRRR